ncbi:hypothetical protein PR202_ga09454 [Eleusine coracana subsp. coracana]|uniref:Uncharacterized protein n=1 Tax=Eleusine coracana subsp. coracana TaxID=191504 RepID=A0AAV5C4N3_ELECO|nr:hypothetical protein PR202_ga09454 [Eleusine coracana subsp. coracana]
MPPPLSSVLPPSRRAPSAATLALSSLHAALVLRAELPPASLPTSGATPPVPHTPLLLLLRRLGPPPPPPCTHARPLAPSLTSSSAFPASPPPRPSPVWRRLLLHLPRPSPVPSDLAVVYLRQISPRAASPSPPRRGSKLV